MKLLLLVCVSLFGCTVPPQAPIPPPVVGSSSTHGMTAVQVSRTSIESITRYENAEVVCYTNRNYGGGIWCFRKDIP